MVSDPIDEPVPALWGPDTCNICGTEDSAKWFSYMPTGAPDLGGGSPVFV
jgi:hypothetical protein